MPPFVPDWAPNVHPMLVHFPIAWLIAAILVDFVACGLPRQRWPDVVCTVLYPVATISALVTYATGRQAAATVLTPGLAHAVVQQHWNWALATTIFFAVYSAARVGLFFKIRSLGPPHRVVLALVALAGLVLLFYTGELGARLVYEYGVGVRSPR